MIALVIVGLAAVIAIGIVWTRVGLARSERRSMQSHKHTLEVLGGVTRQTDKAAPITPVPADRATLGHIRAERPTRSEPPEPPRHPRIEEAGRFTPVARPPVGRARIGSAGASRFEDDSDAFERMQEEEQKETVLAVPRPTAAVKEVHAAPEPEEATADEVPPREPRRPRPRPQRRQSLVTPGWARVGSMAAVAVILVAIALLAVHFAGGGGPKAAVGTTGGNTRGHTSSGHHHHRAHHPTSTLPSALIPVSTSPTDVSFVAPKGTYTVQMTDTGGTCWVGIQQTTGGPYLWEETLYDGQRASYKASGPLVIRIGAPRYLGVKVNGLPARLPGFVQPYDVTFNPSTPPSSA